MAVPIYVCHQKQLDFVESIVPHTYENQKVKGRKVSDNETETNCKLTKSSNFD